MSYCGNAGQPGVSFANGFGQQPGDRIREWVDDYSYCLNTISTTWCISNHTFSTPTLSYVSNSIVVQNSGCTSTGNVTVNHASGSTFWIAGKSVTLKAGFHKTNTGVFHARIYPWLDCDNSAAQPNGNNAKESEIGYEAEKNQLSTIILDIIPNPTDGLITIYYTVGNTQMAQIDIVNLYGQSISVVANGEQVQGNHTVNFNTSDLASGVYFVQFRTLAGVISKPIVVGR